MNNPTRFSNTYFRLLLSAEWRKKKLPNGVEQFVNYDEDTGTELMMLPTDIALIDDSLFKQWVEIYAADKDRFFTDFSKVFDKLMELGIERDGAGKILNTDNTKGGYHSAPKKSSLPGLPQKSSTDKVDISEAVPLQERNTKFKARI